MGADAVTIAVSAKVGRVVFLLGVHGLGVQLRLGLAQRPGQTVDDLLAGVAVDVKDHLLTALAVRRYEGSGSLVLEGGNLNVGVLVLNLGQVPEDKF